MIKIHYIEWIIDTTILAGTRFFQRSHLFFEFCASLSVLVSIHYLVRGVVIAIPFSVAHLAIAITCSLVTIFPSKFFDWLISFTLGTLIHVG
jgi:hypothetical protein